MGPHLARRAPAARAARGRPAPCRHRDPDRRPHAPRCCCSSSSGLPRGASPARRPPCSSRLAATPTGALSHGALVGHRVEQAEGGVASIDIDKYGHRPRCSAGRVSVMDLLRSVPEGIVPVATAPTSSCSWRRPTPSRSSSRSWNGSGPRSWTCAAPGGDWAGLCTHISGAHGAGHGPTCRRGEVASTRWARVLGPVFSVRSRA